MNANKVLIYSRISTLKRLIILFVLLALITGAFFGCTSVSETEGITSIDQLSEPGINMALSQGAVSDAIAREMFPNATYQYFTEISSAYLAVQEGKSDAFVYDKASMTFAIANGLEGVRLLDETLGEPGQVALGIYPDSDNMLKININSFIEKIKMDGTLDDMYSRWVEQADTTMPEIEVPENPKFTLTVGTTGLVQPYTYYEGTTLTGFDIELTKRLALYLGADIKFKVYNFDGLVAATQSGDVDIASSNLNRTPEREEAIDFSDDIFSVETAILVKGEQSESSADAFEAAKFGIVTGSVGDIYVQESYPNASVEQFTGFADALLALQSDKIDYTVLSYTTALQYMKADPTLKIYKDGIPPGETGIAISKDNPQLLNDINAILDEYKHSGKLDEIAANWTTPGEEYVINPSPVSSGENGVLNVAIAADREPMCFLMGSKYAGLDIELIENIAADLGMTVQYENMQFSSLTPALISGKSDVIISNFSITDERKEVVNFSYPYFTNYTVILGKSDSASVWIPDYLSLQELSGKTIGIVDGSIADILLLEVVPDLEFAYYASIADQITALQTGRVDGLAHDLPVAQLLDSRYDDIMMIQENAVPDNYGVVLPKDSPLTPQINEIIAQLHADGTLEEMNEKWLGSDDSKKVLPVLDYPGEAGTLHAVSQGQSEPMNYYVQGELSGFDIELMMRIGEALDMKVEFTGADFGAIIPMIQSEKADIAASGISITDERKQLVDMSDSYYEAGLYVLTHATSTHQVVEEEVGFFQSISDSFYRTFVVEDRWQLILDGLGITVLLSVFSGIFGGILGFFICMWRRSKPKAVAKSAAIFIRIIQGTPIVVFLMILYYVIFGQIDISAIITAIIGFSINFGVYTSEMMRTGINAIDPGQHEAASALGYTKRQTFWKIIFPQAARHFLPVVKGEFISMVKMTSIVGYIAIQDLTKASDIIRSRTLEAFFPLVVTAILYFIIANVLLVLLSRIEFKLDPKRRSRKIKGVNMK